MERYRGPASRDGATPELGKTRTWLSARTVAGADPAFVASTPNERTIEAWRRGDRHALETVFRIEAPALDLAREGLWPMLGLSR